MTAELWKPSPEDMDTGQEAYIQYIGGLMMLHDPDSPTTRGLIGNNIIANPDGAEAIIRQAEEVMYGGLAVLIASASEPGQRSPLSRAEHRYEQVMPHVKKMVALACEQDAERLSLINPAIVSMRPMPLNNRATYAAVCHSRRRNIVTTKLLGAFMPDPEFAGLLTGRKLQGQRSRNHLQAHHADNVTG